MAKKEKNPTLVSPKLVLKFPRISGDADFTFDKDRGDYSTKALGDPNDAQVVAFMRKLDEETDKAFEQMKAENPKHAKKLQRGAPYKMEEDQDGEETGMVEFGFGMKHKITAKKGPNVGKTFEFRPVLYDSLLKPLDQKSLKVGGGTVAKISFEYFPYIFLGDTKKAGLTKKLLAVQILDLKEWGSGRSGASFGFGEEDEGFTVNEPKDGATDDVDAEDEDENAGDF